MYVSLLAAFILASTPQHKAQLLLDAWPADIAAAQARVPGGMIIMPGELKRAQQCNHLLNQRVGEDEASLYMTVIDTPYSSAVIWLMPSFYVIETKKLKEEVNLIGVREYLCGQHQGGLALGIPTGIGGEIEWLISEGQ